MRIGIIGAMIEEIEGIHKWRDMQWQRSVTIGQRQYHVGAKEGHEVVLVFSRWGKVASASTATTLIDHFKVDAIIFTGVAGAVSSDLNVGDVVVANETMQHDMNTPGLFGRFVIPLTDQSYFSTHTVLKATADTAVEAALETINSSTALLRAKLQQFKISALPKMVSGTIATGDQFISDVNTGSELVRAVNLLPTLDLKCVDMESGAVGQVCYEHSIPYIVVRVISDKADHSAQVDFLQFVKEFAAPFDQIIIQHFLEALPTTLSS
tara:strand:+ start:2421 stop:3218 length:798 start_codon:yes stop_codon:yes gene_type:complete